MGTDLAELAGALAAFQAEVPVIPKKQKAEVKSERGASYTYTYADLASIAPVVMPLLAKHGLCFLARPKGARGDSGPVLVGMLLHSSGQRVTGEFPITGRSPQEIGSSLTYGRRYLLGCLTGVVTDDDDDGQLAERATNPPAKKAPIQRKRRTTPKDWPDKGEPAPVGQTPHGTSDPGAGPTTDDKPPAVSPLPDPARRALFAAIGEALPDAGRTERLALCAAVVGHPLASSSAMTDAEVSACLRWVDDYRSGRETYSYDPETELAYVFPSEPHE